MGSARVPATILSLGLLLGGTGCDAGSAGPRASSSEVPSAPETIRPVDIDGELFARTTSDGTPLRVVARGRVPDCAMLTVRLGEEEITDFLLPATSDLVVAASSPNHMTVQVSALIRTVVWRDETGTEIDRMTPVNGVAVLGRHASATSPAPGPPPKRGSTPVGTVQGLDAQGGTRAEAPARGKLMVGRSCQ